MSLDLNYLFRPFSQRVFLNNGTTNFAFKKQHQHQFLLITQGRMDWQSLWPMLCNIPYQTKGNSKCDLETTNIEILNAHHLNFDKISRLRIIKTIQCFITRECENTRDSTCDSLLSQTKGILRYIWLSISISFGWSNRRIQPNPTLQQHLWWLHSHHK